MILQSGVYKGSCQRGPFFISNQNSVFRYDYRQDGMRLYLNHA